MSSQAKKYTPNPQEAIKLQTVDTVEEIHVTSPSTGTWMVRWRYIGHGYESQHFDTVEPVADFVRRLLLPK